MAEPQKKVDQIFPVDDGEDAADIQAVRRAERIVRDRSMVEHGRRIGGLPGAMMAGAMIALRDIYEGPKRDDGAVVVDAPSEPHDVDRDGVRLRAAEIGSTDGVEVPPQPRIEPIITRRRSRRR